MPPIRRFVLLLGALLLVVQTATARVISFNYAASPTGNSAIDGEETFGVPSLNTVVGNWNNLGSDANDLLWDDGTASTVSVDVNLPNGFDFFGAGYINTPMNYGADHYIATPDDPGTAILIFNLNANFPDGYIVIAYFNAFQGNNGASIRGNATAYYFQPLKPVPATFGPADLMQTTVSGFPAPAAVDIPAAQYAVFGSAEEPLSSDFFNLRLDVLAGGGAALSGFQIVEANGGGGVEPVILTGTFYLDAVNGDDASDGTSPETAWKSLAKLDASAFGPGTHIRFKRGDVFQGRFDLQGSGTPEDPITLGAYGDGPVPRLEALPGDLDVIQAVNAMGIEVRDLEISNYQPAGPHADVYGIRLIVTPGAGDLAHLIFEDLVFVDIAGSGAEHESRAINGATSDADTAIPMTRWNGFRVAGCHFERIDGRAVQMRDLDYTLTDSRIRATAYYPTIGFVFENNTGKDCYRNLLQIRGMKDPLIQHNFHEGTSLGSAFWPFDCEGTLVQFNDFRHLRNPEADGYVCHFDYNCVDSLMQYNFGYDVDGGLIEIIVLSEFQFFQENAVARYNVGVDVGFRDKENAAGIMLSGRVDGSKVYNNTIVTTDAQPAYKAIAINNWGGEWPTNSAVHNNLFLALGSASTFDDGNRLTQAGNVASHNLYHGAINASPAFDTAPVSGDPKLLNPTAWSDPANLKVTVGSPAIGAGLLIADNGGRDFFNYPVSASAAPTIGFHEYQTDAWIDSDGDTMADAWERLYQLDPEVTASETEDTDGDGSPDRAEFLADTDPRDDQSRFMPALEVMGTGAVSLNWVERPERVYSLYESSDLSNWIPSADDVVTPPYPLTSAANRFYQVRPKLMSPE